MISSAPVVSATKRPAKKVTTTTAKTGSSTTSVKTKFRAEVWADNWFSMSVNGILLGEDSVPITTERSFNAETFTFTATAPFTIAIQAKDFKQNESGLEYIGKANQQMGDGGLIAQITDLASGKVVAVTTADWKTLVIHRAPLNPSCEKDAEPETTCRFSSVPEPTNWTAPAFNDSSWKPATVWSATDVGPKGGYNEITWNQRAKFVWGADLHIDNTVLFRMTVR